MSVTDQKYPVTPLPTPVSSYGTGDEPCEECCKNETPNYFCIDCGSTFCEDCWPAVRAHAPGKVNRDGIPHEKSNKIMVERLKEIFTPSSDPEWRRQLHETDAGTTWFGVTRNLVTGSATLHDYGRYSTIMRDSSTGDCSERWPQLVSFVGQTGAGKSTLIKTLVDHQERMKKTQRKDGFPFPSPVAGSINSHSPTSGDVHLYADPGTYHTQLPRLYADCEGIDGGEKIPAGAQCQQIDIAPPKSSRVRSGSINTTSIYGIKPSKKLRKTYKSVKREVQWANTPDRCKREFFVKNLYPRVLYAFSDIVIFVLRNDRIFESGALVPMLQWAASSIESATNQSAMPHAIIVLNFTDPNIHATGWTVKSATENLLCEYANAVFENLDVRKHAEYWQKRGTTVRTTKDLLLCYYSSVNVVRIPQKGRYGLIDQQVAALNQEIQTRCSQAHENRKHLRVVLNSEEFQAALSMGFDHFSHRLDEPFDFVELFWSLNPIPKDFGGNILRLALAIKEDPKMVGASGRLIFQHLSHMVASCVMLDFVRHHIKGTATRLINYYRESYTRALTEFCEDWWPCSFSRCVNTKRGHIRGHQDAKGNIISTKPYQSAQNFSEMSFGQEWDEMLNHNLQNIREAMDRMKTGDAIDEEPAAEDLHLRRMNEFYFELGDLSCYMNHSACFCCLRELAEHPLPCGHVICTPCVKSYARRKNQVTYAMHYCPLHWEDKWDQEWDIPVKPHMAGVRILTLDGGGIRGIVELQVLATIQRHLGNLQIRNFFDLIVGTSTGGLVSMGLGVKNWTIEECIGKFENLCQRAFTPREFHNVPVLEQVTTFAHKGKYKTRPFIDALKEAFDKDQLFGGVCEEPRYQRKVAVVSTIETNQRAVILTNYNRPQREAEPDYKFERPQRVNAEFKIWEACRATSAAPPYFKAFDHISTGNSYIDGALYYNNPIRVANQERKLLWPDVESQPPDIVLSIGTSCTADCKSNSSKVKSWFVPKMFQAAVNRFDNILDAQNAWDQFHEEVCEPSSTVHQRYIRMNPEVAKKIQLDDVDSIYHLKQMVDTALKSQKWRNDTKAVAFRLIASSFYFQKDHYSGDEATVQGHIQCRFPDDSPELRILGSHFQSLRFERFSPQFIVTEQYQDQQGSIVLILSDAITAMIQQSTFSVEKLTIPLSSKLAKTTISLLLTEGGEAFPISGFPRHLITEDVTGAAAKQAQNQTTKRYASTKWNPRNGNPSSPSLSVPTNSVPEEDDSASSEGQADDMPRWARVYTKKRSHNSLRREKKSAELNDSSAAKNQTINSTEPQSATPRSKRFFRWNANASAVNIATGDNAQRSHRSTSGEEPLTRETSSKSLPEIRASGAPEAFMPLNGSVSTSEPQLNTSATMPLLTMPANTTNSSRILGHDRSVSGPSTLRPRAPGPGEARPALRRARSQSPQLSQFAPFSQSQSERRMPTPNALNILTNMESFEYGQSSTVSPPPQYAAPQQERRLEEMSEEEQFQLAVRESIATASPVRASGRPQAFSTGSPDPTYTLHSTDARPVPYMSGAVGTRRAELEDSSGAFGATPLSSLPRASTGNVPRAELESVERQSRENPSGMTEEEMVKRAIAESMRIF